MAAGARKKQSECDRHPSLHRTVVLAGAGAHQQPDRGNPTTGKNKVVEKLFMHLKMLHNYSCKDNTKTYFRDLICN